MGNKERVLFWDICAFVPFLTIPLSIVIGYESIIGESFLAIGLLTHIMFVVRVWISAIKYRYIGWFFLLFFNVLAYVGYPAVVRKAMLNDKKKSKMSRREVYLFLAVMFIGELVAWYFVLPLLESLGL